MFSAFCVFAVMVHMRVVLPLTYLFESFEITAHGGLGL